MSDARREQLVRVAVLGLGVYQLGLATFIVVFPHAFFDSLGGFDHFNQHYLQDAAAFEGALGVGLLLAFPRPGWWLPLLAVATAHFSLHAVSHLIDIAQAHHSWIGYFDFFAIAGGAVQLGWLTAHAARLRRTPAA
jgi:hypothetical protein